MVNPTHIRVRVQIELGEFFRVAAPQKTGISVSLTIGQLFVILYDPDPFSLNKGEHQLSDFVCRVNQDNWQGSGSALLYLRPLVLVTGKPRPRPTSIK